MSVNCCLGRLSKPAVGRRVEVGCGRRGKFTSVGVTRASFNSSESSGDEDGVGSKNRLRRQAVSGLIAVLAQVVVASSASADTELLNESQRMRLEMLEQIERYRTSSATPAVKEFEPPSPPPGPVNQELPSSSSEEALPTLPTVISEEESLSLPGTQDEESAPPPSTSSAVTETASPSSSAANDAPEQSLPASETLSPTPNTIPKVSDEYTKSLPPQSAAVPAEEQAGGNITVGLIGLVGGVLVGVAVLLNLPTDLAATANSSNAVVDTTPEGEKQQNYSSQAKDSEHSTIPGIKFLPNQGHCMSHQG
jgi:hypothetical protein